MKYAKKISAILLGACVLCAGTNMVAAEGLEADGATGNTTVTYEVSSSNFVVTIPPSVTIDSTSKTGSIDVELDASTYVPSYTGSNEAMQITVFLSAAANRSSGVNYLVNGDNKLAYTIKKGSSNVGIGTAPVSNAIINWTTRNSTKTASAALDLAVTGTASVAGNYSDTLTFTVTTMELGGNETPIL